MDAPYTNYCSQFVSGFDSWPSVQSNARLPSVLESFSVSNPPPPGPPQWTLDGLFAFPRSRIKYYQKLYGRLLKGSPPGKNADKLVHAVEKLTQLLEIMDERSNVLLPGASGKHESMVDEVVIDTRDGNNRVGPGEIGQITSNLALTSLDSSAHQSTTSSELVKVFYGSRKARNLYSVGNGHPVTQRPLPMVSYP